MDESGRVRHDDVFTVGILMTHNPQWLLDKVSKIRQEYNYFNEFHLKKLSARSLPIIKALLTEVFSYYDSRKTVGHFYFRSVCVLGKTAIRRHSKEHISYNYYCKWAIAHNMGKHFDTPDGKGSVLYIDHKSRADGDNLLSEIQAMANEKRANSLKSVQNMDSKKSDLLQISDILTGLVRFRQMLKHDLIYDEDRNSQSSIRKQELLELIEAYYGKKRPISCHEITSTTLEESKSKYINTP